MRQDLRKHISRAIVGIRRLAPFYAYLATTRDYVEDETCPTMWTDGKRIGINPSFALGLSADQFRTVIVHELEHTLKGDPWRLRLWMAGRLHAEKGREGIASMSGLTPDQGHRVWNMAADHSINNRLTGAGFAPIDGWLCDPEFAGMATESIVPFMPVPDDEDQGGNSEMPIEAPGGASDGDQAGDGMEGQPDCQNAKQGASGKENGHLDPNASGDAVGGEDGDAAGDPTGDAAGDGDAAASDPGDCGEQIVNPCGECRPAPGTDDEAAEALRARKHDCRNAVRYAEGCGRLDEGIRAEVAAMMTPDVDYADLLSIFMHEHAQRDEDWTNLDRDYVHYDIAIPTEDEPAIGDVLFFVDTSGSMNRAAFDEVAGHIASICHDLESRLHVVYVDNAVRGYQIFDEMPEIEDFEVSGGGGTSFVPGFTFADKQQIDPACAIYFTDLCCSRFPAVEPDYPVLWVQWGTKKTKQSDLPFGELIKREGVL
jgi:predicted metal-dependent peptidase